jgi:hypothetical protein
MTCISKNTGPERRRKRKGRNYRTDLVHEVCHIDVEDLMEDYIHAFCGSRCARRGSTSRIKSATEDGDTHKIETHIAPSASVHAGRLHYYKAQLLQQGGGQNNVSLDRVQSMPPVSSVCCEPVGVQIYSAVVLQWQQKTSETCNTHLLELRFSGRGLAGTEEDDATTISQGLVHACGEEFPEDAIRSYLWHRW